MATRKSPLQRVGGYIGNAMREARDVPTAIGTSLGAQFDYQNRGPANEAATKRAAISSGNNQDRQLVEAINAIIKGKKGTSSDQIDKNGKYVKGRQR